jgi:hypothetical protein
MTFGEVLFQYLLSTEESKRQSLCDETESSLRLLLWAVEHRIH